MIKKIPREDLILPPKRDSENYMILDATPITLELINDPLDIFCTREIDGTETNLKKVKPHERMLESFFLSSTYDTTGI